MVSNLARKTHTQSKIIISGVNVKLDGGPFLIPGEQTKIRGKNRFVAPSEGAISGVTELIYILEQSNNKTCAGTGGPRPGQHQARVTRQEGRGQGHEC